MRTVQWRYQVLVSVKFCPIQQQLQRLGSIVVNKVNNTCFIYFCSQQIFITLAGFQFTQWPKLDLYHCTGTVAIVHRYGDSRLFFGRIPGGRNGQVPRQFEFFLISLRGFFSQNNLSFLRILIFLKCARVFSPYRQVQVD